MRYKTHTYQLSWIRVQVEIRNRLSFTLLDSSIIVYYPPGKEVCESMSFNVSQNEPKRWSRRYQEPFEDDCNQRFYDLSNINQEQSMHMLNKLSIIVCFSVCEFLIIARVWWLIYDITYGILFFKRNCPVWISVAIFLEKRKWRGHNRIFFPKAILLLIPSIQTLLS